MQSIKKLKKLKNKKVLVRVDYNVPVQNGKVMDDFRIRKSVPTLVYLLGKGANLHILMHLGEDGSLDVSPVVEHFFKITKFPKDRITFSENIRKFDGEMKNDPKFAKSLSSGYDYFVNEAFSVSHRSHASIVGVPKYLPAYSGLQFDAEIKNLNMCVEKIKHPFLFILGGAKFSTKLPLVKKFLNRADHVFVGGALFNEFLQSAGLEVGRSSVDKDLVLPKSILNNKKILLPVDVLVDEEGVLEYKKIEEIGKEDLILDIGPESVNLLNKMAEKAKLVLWNGPLGKYEDRGDKATKSVLKKISGLKSTTIIGGGDTAEIVNELKIESKFTFVSTGGGATLEFLANGTLPGIKALK